MLIEFIGVGEAFEPEIGSASYLLHSETKLLIDCGFGTPAFLFAHHNDMSEIDALYLTHFHADHTFGVPPLLNRFAVEGRTKPLTVIGQPGTKQYLSQVIDLGYPNCLRKLTFPLNYIETTDELPFNELRLSFAKSDHKQSNYALKVEKSGISLGLSGDGGLTDSTKTLFHDCHYLIHEAFGFDEAIDGHTTAKVVMEYAKSLPRLKVLALVHIQRDERIHRKEDFKMLNEQVPFHVMIPKPGEIISLS